MLLVDSHRSIVGAIIREMKLWIAISCVLAGCLSGAPILFGQQQPANDSSQSTQNKPADKTQKPQSNANPFPEDTNNVPVLPNANSGNEPEAAPPDEGRVSIPARDTDPARSPEEQPAGESTESSSESSSDVPGLDKLIPKPDEETKASKEAPEYQETAADDITVGKYYLDRKDWKAALSRFQSALVLAPQNAEVYWGLAESDRHLGDFADARSYYLKVMEYDPDSHHYKEAEKALKEPEIANAKAPAPGKAAVGSPQ
jgi:tetratricopeptide (TPR) repeat protein